MASARTGKGSLNLKNPSKAKSRALSGKSANARALTKHENTQYTDKVPF